jgi:hypothetical protein
MTSREQIIRHVFDICVAHATDAAIDVKTVVRNRGLIDNDKRPAIVILDGDEQPAILAPQSRTNSRHIFRPALVAMSPQIFIIMDELRPTGDKLYNGQLVNIGTSLNLRRDALVKVLVTDAPLANMLGPNGAIIYNGCETDLKSGGGLAGQMRIDFIIKYLYDPTTP